MTINLISGFMVGIEFVDEEGVRFVVIDLGLIRIFLDY